MGGVRLAALAADGYCSGVTRRALAHSISLTMSRGTTSRPEVVRRPRGRRRATTPFRVLYPVTNLMPNGGLRTALGSWQPGGANGVITRQTGLTGSPVAGSSWFSNGFR